MDYKILTGDNRQTLRSIPSNTIDAIVTDPPYGIDFLGKDWDANTGALETYQECLRVLKPGGHIVAFSAARTYHHLAITLEQAGFEIRDQIMWIYSSGFPKSQDVGKSIDRSAKKITALVGNTKKTQKVVHNSPPQLLCSVCNKDANARYSCDKGQECGMIYKPQTKEAEQWAGWGTALKPAHEPIALARKPMKLSIAKNCLTHGVGALNIDATRVPYADDDNLEEWYAKYPEQKIKDAVYENYNPEKRTKKDLPKGARKSMQTGAPQFQGSATDTSDKEVTWEASSIGRFPSNVIGEIPDYQKYFYCPKVSRSERHVGFDDPGPLFPGMSRVEVNMGGLSNSSDKNKTNTRADVEKASPGNNHPTVKPIELMKYLIKLITPPGGTVLDPFNGSGSTGMAAVELGHPYIGCELDPKYVEISTKRIEAWYRECNPTTFGQLFDTK